MSEPKPGKLRNIALTKTEETYATLLDAGFNAEGMAEITGRKVTTVRTYIWKVREKRRDLENMAKVRES